MHDHDGYLRAAGGQQDAVTVHSDIGSAMHARSAVIEVSSDRVDEVSRAMQEELIPRYQEADGYEGFVLMANRQSGKVLGISFWETESDLEASDDLGADARQRLADAGGGAQPGPREVWEVLVDDEA
jgi:hypothetical protein